MSLNKVMLIGNVGQEPTIRYLDQNSPQGATKVASFTLATTERYRDRGGEIRENTEWHNIVAWRNNADVVERFVHKGTQLYIEGKLRTRSWTDQTGNKRYTTEINTDTLQLLGRRPDGQGEGAPAAQPAYQQPQYQAQPIQPAYQQPQQPAYQQSQQSQQPAYQQPAPAAPAEPDAVDVIGDDLPF